MYRPRAYAVDELSTLHEFIRERSFATIAAAVKDRPLLAYAPMVLDASGKLGTVRFHLARINPMADIPDGTPLTLSFLGPDAYISPDWYVSEGQVPTWNYMTVEGSGSARRLASDEMLPLLADLSASQEAQLAPKKPWTVDKVPDAKLASLLRAIVGFAVEFETLEGKFKLSQDKNPDDVAGVIAGLEVRGTAGPIAAAMRRTRKRS